jgi:hypothetical protein
MSIHPYMHADFQRISRTGHQADPRIRSPARRRSHHEDNQMHERESTPQAIDAIRDHLARAHGRTDFDLLRDVAYLGNSPAGARVVYLPESGFLGARFACKHTACAELIFPAGAPTYGHPERNASMLLAHPELSTTLLHGITDPAERAIIIEDWDRGAWASSRSRRPTRAAPCTPKSTTARASTSGAGAASSSWWRGGAGRRRHLCPGCASHHCAARLCGAHVRTGHPHTRDAQGNTGATSRSRCATPPAPRAPGSWPHARLRPRSRRTRLRAPGRRMRTLGPDPRWWGCPRGVLRMPARRFADVRVAFCGCPSADVHVSLCGCPFADEAGTSETGRSRRDKEVWSVAGLWAKIRNESPPLR